MNHIGSLQAVVPIVMNGAFLSVGFLKQLKNSVLRHVI